MLAIGLLGLVGCTQGTGWAEGMNDCLPQQVFMANNGFFKMKIGDNTRTFSNTKWQEKGLPLAATLEGHLKNTKFKRDGIEWTLYDYMAHQGYAPVRWGNHSGFNKGDLTFPQDPG